MIRSWIRAFLTGRTAQVRSNSAFSRKVFMIQDLPQVAVSSPLLFLLYINGIYEIIPNEVKLALIADDGSEWSSTLT